MKRLGDKMIRDLAGVANRLDSLGLTKEADALDLVIQKLAREYVHMVAKDGVSKRFYKIISNIETEVFNWKEIMIPKLIDNLLASGDPRLLDSSLTHDNLHKIMEDCLESWAEEYSRSIGAEYSSIPPWLFSFLEEKIFPILKESFAKAIGDLPADSETKAGLQEWLSQTTLNQLGAPNLSEALYGGVDLWTAFINNAIHEIHHNILNHSVWKRFSLKGQTVSSYNILDDLEEGFALSIPDLSHSSEEKSWDELAEKISDFLYSSILRIILKNDDAKKFYQEHGGEALGDMLYVYLPLVYQELDQIDAVSMGIKSPEEKKAFLKKILDTFYIDYLSEYGYYSIKNFNDFRQALTESIKEVWSKPISRINYNKWDFLTGDDEELLITLMKDLDSKADLLWSTWSKYKADFYLLAKDEIKDCIDLKLN